MFSAGCILYEMLTGRPLFHRAKSDAERLAAMEHALGFFPRSVVEAAGFSTKGVFYYTTGAWRVKFPRTPQVSEYTPVELERAYSRLVDTRYFKVCFFFLIRLLNQSSIDRRGSVLYLVGMPAVYYKRCCVCQSPIEFRRT